MTHHLLTTQTFENMSYILWKRLLHSGTSADPSEGAINHAGSR
ncbi:hypothetical protein [Paenibacillus solani]|nr:hypothetical protein [Paenibacillus solani]